MTNWAALESPLSPSPRFFVEAPDGRKDWSELNRQATFFKLMRTLGPRCAVFPVPNAGKRAAWKARKEGICAGVFDVCAIFRETCWIEFKGYSSAGRPGQLTDAQVEFGNRLIELGQHCACFFSPYSAIDWLRDKAFPIRSAA